MCWSLDFLRSICSLIKSNAPVICNLVHEPGGTGDSPSGNVLCLYSSICQGLLLYRAR